jgi:hypothetical protein
LGQRIAENYSLPFGFSQRSGNKNKKTSVIELSKEENLLSDACQPQAWNGAKR